MAASRKLRQVDSTTVIMLVYLVVAAIALSVSRAPVAVIHPILAGPRYFFYPYVFLGWLLLQLTATRWVWLRVVTGGLVLVAALQAVLIGPRHNDDLQWQEALMACAGEPSETSVSLPVQYAGSADDLWHVELTTAQCRNLVEGGLLQHLH